MKYCTYCGQQIQSAAIVCKHCGWSLKEGKPYNHPNTIAKWNEYNAAAKKQKKEEFRKQAELAKQKEKSVTRPCPYCKRRIDLESKICSYCKNEIVLPHFPSKEHPAPKTERGTTTTYRLASTESKDYVGQQRAMEVVDRANRSTQGCSRRDTQGNLVDKIGDLYIGAVGFSVIIAVLSAVVLLLSAVFPLILVAIPILIFMAIYKGKKKKST